MPFSAEVSVFMHNKMIINRLSTDTPVAGYRWGEVS